MRFNNRNFLEKAKMIEEQYDYGNVQAWALEYYNCLMHELAEMLQENIDEARPYTGEYWMGKADLLCEILGLPEIDWDSLPNFQFRSSTPLKS